MVANTVAPIHVQEPKAQLIGGAYALVNYSCQLKRSYLANNDVGVLFVYGKSVPYEMYRLLGYCITVCIGGVPTVSVKILNS
jgi:hypothetical protein